MPEIHDEMRQDGTKKQRRQGGLVIPPNRWDLGYLSWVAGCSWNHVKHPTDIVWGRMVKCFTH